MSTGVDGLRGKKIQVAQPYTHINSRIETHKRHAPFNCPRMWVPFHNNNTEHDNKITSRKI